MQYFVYILYNQKDKNLYTDYTCNLEKRMAKHDNSLIRSTCYRRPLSLIYFEEFKHKGETFQGERFLKSLWGAREKKKILKRYFISCGAKP